MKVNEVILFGGHASRLALLTGCRRQDLSAARLWPLALGPNLARLGKSLPCADLHCSISIGCPQRIQYFIIHWSRRYVSIPSSPIIPIMHDSFGVSGKILPLAGHCEILIG